MVPLWDDILNNFFTVSVLTASLAAWILSGRRWNAYGFWVVLGLGLVHYICLVVYSGWGSVMPQDPLVHFTGHSITGVRMPIVADSRWGMHAAAKTLDWLVVILSLSAPLWRNWLRRKLDLKDSQTRGGGLTNKGKQGPFDGASPKP
jgi:hypothetical protein